MVVSGLEYYDYLMSLGDRRVETWGLMSSPLPTLLITALYLLLCLRGPRLMSRFPAFSLRPVVVELVEDCDDDEGLKDANLNRRVPEFGMEREVTNIFLFNFREVRLF